MRLGRTTALAVAAACLVVAGCGPEEQAADPESSGRSASPSQTTTGPSDEPTVDEHAVEPPGPRKGRLWSADILVFAEEPLSEETLRQIKAVRGVAHLEVLGLGQAAVENQVVNVAAVDPATYRHFTPVSTAQSQEVWDRVAGGELAIDQRLGKKLADQQGYITLGSDDDAPQVHVGGLAPQVPFIQAVVNGTWSEDLHLPLGNAVLVSTDIVSPAVVRPKIRKIVGESASIQALDIAARLGLDPNAKQLVVPTGGTVGDAVGTFNYRVLADGMVEPDASWVDGHISTRVMPIIGEMTCNNAVFEQLEAALEEIQVEGLASTIYPDEYAGCYYPRFIAGSTTLSNHAFGLAFDINTSGNQRGTTGEIDRRVVAILEKWGFAWRGRWSYTDPMHFELSRVVKPG